MISGHTAQIARATESLSPLQIFNHDFRWVIRFTGFAFQRNKLKERLELCQKLINECQEILNGKEKIPLEEDVPAFDRQIQKAWIVGKMYVLTRSKERMTQVLLAFPEVMEVKQRIIECSKASTVIPTVPCKTVPRLPPRIYGLIGDFLFFSERCHASRTCKAFRDLADKTCTEIIYDKSKGITPLYIRYSPLDYVFVMEAIFRKLENTTLSRYELSLAIFISEKYFKKSDTFRSHRKDFFFCAATIADEAGKYLSQGKMKP